MVSRALKIVQYGALPYLHAELSHTGKSYRFAQTTTRLVVTSVYAVLVVLSGIPPLLVLIYDLNTLDLTEWISLLELLLEWCSALLAYLIFFHHRMQTTNLLNETINTSERMLSANAARANHFPRIVNRWLIRLTIIVTFHLLLACSISDAIPEQWLSDPLHSVSYRFSLFCASFILSTYVRSLELYMLFIDHTQRRLYGSLNIAMQDLTQIQSYRRVLRMIEDDAELNGLVVAFVQLQNAVIASVLFYHFFGTVSDSYELFVGLKEVFDAVRHGHALFGAVLLRSSLKLLLRCIDFHSMIYGFNKLHQRQIDSTFSVCQNIPAAEPWGAGINYGRMQEIVTLHMMHKSASIDISGVISLNNSLLFKVMGSTLGFIVLLMQFKLSEQV
ncbi:uncharacterized protein LOC118509209 [Anopheles stephensi]|uniref:uncharacterized protein LOC118509209 n=1 Tax=Anopheles stephensi TaxID=30069 RepID=UPI001658C14B|nr:uncharacterized protein LOC118509209 [Anopheles stephensi]